MIVFYFDDGEVESSIYNSSVYKKRLPIRVVYKLGIDEVEENASLCQELFSSNGEVDANGLGRWYVEDGELFERDNWMPYL